MAVVVEAALDGAEAVATDRDWGQEAVAFVSVPTAERKFHTHRGFPALRKFALPAVQ